jgi:hypothetical protein
LDSPRRRGEHLLLTAGERRDALGLGIHRQAAGLRVEKATRRARGEHDAAGGEARTYWAS